MKEQLTVWTVRRSQHLHLFLIKCGVIPTVVSLLVTSLSNRL